MKGWDRLTMLTALSKAVSWNDSLIDAQTGYNGKCVNRPLVRSLRLENKRLNRLHRQIQFDKEKP